MREPTDRQDAVLRFVARHHHEQGCPPTLREIGEHMGIRSTNGVNDHLKALERKGYLVRRERLSRSIKLTPKADAYLATRQVYQPGEAVMMTPANDTEGAP